jgi:hypothetical protein
MKSFKQFLMETPLPDDWDKAIYSERVPFRRRVEYAKQMAKRIGSGSSRIVFEIPYQGRKTVLKIAKNTKGMAQNEEESTLCNDYYLDQLGIIVPCIDYDEINSKPTWIHLEYANKITESQFKKLVGGDPFQLVTFAKNYFGRTRNKYARIPELDPENTTVAAFLDYYGNYDANIDDYSRIKNWGLYKNRPVIIDFGFSDEVHKKYYSR